MVWSRTLGFTNIVLFSPTTYFFHTVWGSVIWTAFLSVCFKNMGRLSQTWLQFRHKFTKLVVNEQIQHVLVPCYWHVFYRMILQFLEVSDWAMEYFIAYSRLIPLQANHYIYNHVRATLFTQRAIWEPTGANKETVEIGLIIFALVAKNVMAS